MPEKTTIWNQRQLDGPWINTGNGRLLRPHGAPGGFETMPAAGGRSVNGSPIGHERQA